MRYLCFYSKSTLLNSAIARSVLLIGHIKTLQEILQEIMNLSRLCKFSFVVYTLTAPENCSVAY